jgi:hypothetical protein
LFVGIVEIFHVSRRSAGKNRNLDHTPAGSRGNELAQGRQLTQGIDWLRLLSLGAHEVGA